MEIPKTYEPQKSEEKWYKHWMEKNYFHSEPDDREPYTIVIPPPNVTGVLHMGHMLNNTIQDVLIRRARMQGKNACWVPGTDHASIATEAKVVAMLKEQGINKKDLTREQFLDHAWEWKEKYGGIILKQLEKLGASCDWERTKFTMDPDLSDAVIDTFIRLYRKGYIYRGVRMVNWDPQGRTAVSDEEVIRREVNQKLFYIRYKLSEQTGDGTGNGDYLIIATTRPETIMADTAVCVHPEDERYQHLIGRKILIPLINRPVNIIADAYVERDFGTGCLKVTPAHDLNDYELGIKHNLEVIDILDEDGRLNDKAQILVGEDRFNARKEIVRMLEEAGQIEKIEEYKSQVGFSERTDAVIEPRLSMQWFCRMEELAKPALDYVNNKEVRLIPEKFINTYRHWMENIKDWTISRQLWWGQRIPAWYNDQNEWVVAKTEEEAKAQFLADGKSSESIRQEDDVLDTWFSSALWPMSVFDGVRNPDNKEINYYYPTSDLITAPEILFFWVARMIMAGYEYRDEPCFRNVYFTGIVRDKLGRKMSKSLGNSPDPIELMDKYGADGVRMGMLLTSPAGNDLPFDESVCEQGRNFNNKIWNAFRLIKGWKVDENIEQPETAKIATKWFENKLSETVTEVDDLFSKYRLSEALMLLYKLFWDEFSAWYLEMIKPEYRQPIDGETYRATLHYFDALTRLLHPFMPFITEELWQALYERKEGESIMTALQPGQAPADKGFLAGFETLKEIVAGVRTIRVEKNIPNKDELELHVIGRHDHQYDSVISKVCRLSSIASVSEKQGGATGFLVGTTEYSIPLAEKMDVEAELEKLKTELSYTEGFLQSVMKKLGNERFVQNAKPQIVEAERKKQADAESKIALLKENIAALSSEE